MNERDDLLRDVKNIIWQGGGCEDVEKFEQTMEDRRHIPIEDRLAESDAAFVALEERLKRAIKESTE